jgi:hypothetical protein
MYRPERYTGIRDDELTTAEVAAMFGVNVRSVRTWIRQRLLKARRINTDAWAVDRQDVERALYGIAPTSAFDPEDTEEL